MVFKSNKVSASDTPPEIKTDDEGTKWKGTTHNHFNLYLIFLFRYE
jgi:hypothetical protein